MTIRNFVCKNVAGLFCLLLGIGSSHAQEQGNPDLVNRFLPADTVLCANGSIVFEIPAEYVCSWLASDSTVLPDGENTNRYEFQGNRGDDGLGGGADARYPVAYLLKYRHQDSTQERFDRIQIYPLIQPTVEIEMDSSLICRNEEVLIQPDYALVHESFYQVLWSDNSSDPELETNLGGIYTVSFQLKDSLNHCGFTPALDTITLLQVDTALTNLPPTIRTDTTICPDLELELDATVPFASTLYQWRTGSLPEDGSLPTDTLFDPNPVYTIEEEGVYNLLLIDSMGCVNATEINVQLDPEECKPSLQIPDVITPNGDGLNDDLTFQELKYCEDVEIRIVSRWGQVVLKEKVKRAEDFSWNGCLNNGNRPLPDGAYYYMVSYKDMYGRKKVQSGTVTILGSRVNN